jgi:hypothetical protein
VLDIDLKAARATQSRYNYLQVPHWNVTLALGLRRALHPWYNFPIQIQEQRLKIREEICLYQEHGKTYLHAPY